MTPEETVKSFAQAMTEKKPGQLWDMLPETYQADINAVVSTAASKSDPDMHNKGALIFAKLVNVLKNKKEYILALPMLQQIPNVDPAKVAANYDTVVGILSTIQSSDLMNLDAMKKADVGKFLKGPGTTLASQLSTVIEAFGSEEAKTAIAAFNNIQTKVTKSDETGATLEVTFDGETKPVELTKVGDRWVPAKMASEWPSTIAEAKANIEKADPAVNKLQVLGMMGAVSTILEQLEKAESQEQFNQMLMSSIGPFIGGMGAPDPMDAAPSGMMPGMEEAMPAIPDATMPVPAMPAPVNE
jgi:hypothetical protein